MNDYDNFVHRKVMAEAEQMQDMVKPVRCVSCHRIYDLGKVEVTARYTDCSMWKAPCCGRVADDRGESGWKSTKDYYVIDKSPYLDLYGWEV